MSKAVIALRGVGDSGKSTTIKMVYSLLSEECKLQILEEYDGVVDQWVIFKLNGKKVGIESQGDPGSRLERTLRHFKDEGCDIIVCATRTRGKTNEWVTALDPPYSILWEQKTRADTPFGHARCNKSDARKITDKVKANVGLI